jgi:hypothetical protein
MCNNRNIYLATEKLLIFVLWQTFIKCAVACALLWLSFSLAALLLLGNGDEGWQMLKVKKRPLLAMLL